MVIKRIDYGMFEEIIYLNPSFSEKKNKIVGDPAIKTIVMGLGATITGIDEKN